MKTLTNIKTQTKPEEGVDYSETAVTVIYNIREEKEIDPVFKTETVSYIYDMDEYTVNEWNRITTDSIVDELDIIDHQTVVSYLAITEMINNFMNPKNPKISSLCKVYTALILRGFITMEDVPEVFKDGVQVLLENSSEN